MSEMEKDITNTNLLFRRGESFEYSEDKIKEYRSKWDLNPKNLIVENFPLHLDIESTSHCNLRCTFCANRVRRFKKGHMDFELCKRIIDEGASKGLYAIKFNLRGEPLLNAELPDMIRYAKRKGIIDVFFNTNGLLMEDAFAERIMDAGLDRIIFSVEERRQDIYEKYRVGSNFKQVFKNILAFRKLREKKRMKKPRIRIQSAQIPEVIGKEKDYIEFWSPFADEVTIEKLRDERRDFTNIKGEWNCPYPWLRLGVGYDGEIFHCHQAPYLCKGIGNCRDTDIEEIWHSAQMGGLRQLHRNGQGHRHKACSRCSYRGTELTTK